MSLFQSEYYHRIFEKIYKAETTLKQKVAEQKRNECQRPILGTLPKALGSCTHNHPTDLQNRKLEVPVHLCLKIPLGKLIKHGCLHYYLHLK